ncbi:13522_t:CDS:2, partial [Cetraspora pellucida]
MTIYTWTIELPHTTTSNFLQTLMKIEAETETLMLAPYLKFEKHEVEHFGSLPTEVEELMQSVGGFGFFVRVAYFKITTRSGDIDVSNQVYDGILSWTTGYAAVVTSTCYYVWDYKKDHNKQPLKLPDIVYKFQMPFCDDEPIDSDKLPLVCLIPSAE